MTLNVGKADSIRRYWITDPMKSWSLLEDELHADTKHNCMVNAFGVISENGTIETCGRKGIYVGHLLNIWGHCITDNLKKLWFLRTDLCKSLLSDGYEIYCTIHNGTFLIPNFCQLLEYLGLDASKFKIISEETPFEELFVPQNSLSDNHQCYREYKELIDEIWSKIPVSSTSINRKVYFSRSRFGNRRDFGERYIENVFRGLGYSIIYPELLSLAEQLYILKNCESFAATEGSISHNVMFCKDGTECIILRKTRSCNGYQYTANHLRDLNLVYVDVHLSIFNIFDNAFGPFFLYVNQNVVDFAKERGLTIKKHFPKLTFLNYLLHTLYYAIRYRQKVLKIGDFDFYKKRLKEDFFS